MASEKIKYQKEFDFISQLCDEIDKFTLKRFKDRDFSVMTKDDMSPVKSIVKLKLRFVMQSLTFFQMIK